MGKIKRFKVEERDFGENERHFIDENENRIATAVKNENEEGYHVVPYFIRLKESVKAFSLPQIFVILRDLLRENGHEEADF